VRTPALHTVLLLLLLLLLQGLPSYCQVAVDQLLLWFDESKGLRVSKPSCVFACMM